MLPSSTRPRILIIGDEAPVCNLVSDVLSGAAYEPLCALSDDAAYELLKRARRW